MQYPVSSKLTSGVVLFLHTLLPQVAPPSPSLLLEVTLAANMAHPTPFAGGSSDRNARGLSGPDRVALLKCLSKAAGVGRLAVALGQLKLAQTYATRVSAAAAAAGEGAGMLLLGGWHHRFQELTFRVRPRLVWCGWAGGGGLGGGAAGAFKSGRVVGDSNCPMNRGSQYCSLHQPYFFVSWFTPKDPRI